MKKILVAIPTAKYIEVETFKSLWDLEVPKGYELDFQYFFGYEISQIRNLSANWGKAYDYMFFVDSDIILPKHALKAMLESDKDIISGLYIQRIPNTHTLEVYMDTPSGGCTNIPYSLLKGHSVVEIAACGMGCCLIKSEVLRKLEYPHFFYKSALSKEETISEDVYFCLKARHAGFSVWADVSIKCDHVGQKKFVVDDEKLTRYREIGTTISLPIEHKDYIKTMTCSPKVIYDIGSSVLHWSKVAKKKWPSASFYLFEAMEDVGPYYEENGFVNYYLGVFSDKPGKHVKFYSDPMNFGGNSYYKETTGFFEGKETQRVTNSIDTVVNHYGIPTPDLVKMDVQGAELDILKGAVETFKETKDFILELQHSNYNEGAPMVEEVVKYMDEQGYKLISNFTKTAVDGDYHFTKKTPK